MLQNKKRIVIFFAVIVIIAVFLVIFFSIDKIQRLYIWKTVDNAERPLSMLDTEEEQEAPVYYDGKAYTLNKNISTCLIMGIDDFGDASASGSYNNSGQADFLMLVVFDNENETYKLIHLNRDTMTAIGIIGADGKSAGTTNAQLALAHAYGTGLKDSCENTVSAVSNLFYGTDIDNYLSMNMDAVGKINDMIGGVTLTVRDDFTDCEELKAGETVNLSGDLALKYVRGRMNVADGTNLSRMGRQEQYMDAFVSKFREQIAKDDSLIVNMFNEVSEYMVTDFDVNQVSTIADKIKTYTNDGMLSPDGTAEQGEKYIEYYVDDDVIRQLTISLFYFPTGENAQ